MAVVLGHRLRRRGSRAGCAVCIADRPMYLAASLYSWAGKLGERLAGGGRKSEGAIGGKRRSV